MFDGAARALHAGLAIRTATATLELAVRVGIHTGEIELAGDDVRGVAIHEAAWIMAQAGAGEVLVSDVTRQLASGAGFAFQDRGETELRGVSGVRPVYLVDVARPAA